MAIYEKSVKLLFRDMIKDLGIKKGDVIKREQFFSWFKEKYPKIKDGTISAHLLKMSINAPSRIHYNVHSNGEDDLLFQIDSQKFRLFDPPSDPEPIYKKQDAIIEPDDEPLKVSEFAYEKDLQNFLSKNLYQIEPGIQLYEEEGITGIEFPVGNRYIDILALDNDNNYVVVELKVSRGYDRVVGQLLRYMAWIRKNQADKGQVVRGIIIAREISEDLLLACSEIPNIDLYEYQLSVSLKKVNEK
ncbi:MAG: DUF91 domain-containing protein [Deltaproteobacteria bacterium]|nr:DUF91 domain-containing protein [Deltaproteobacteria bacterium]